MSLPKEYKTPCMDGIGTFLPLPGCVFARSRRRFSCLRDRCERSLIFVVQCYVRRLEWMML